jgi:hypothetical protein
MTVPAEAARGYGGPGAERDYDRDYDRAYGLEPDRPAPPPPPAPGPPPGPPDWSAGGGKLVPVVWHGTDLDPGNVDAWFTAIVENVEGWYASPPLSGNSAERALADGGFYGLKVLGPREITISGSCIGPRADIMGWRDRIAGLAAERQPSELAITDPWLGTTRTAMVRADSDSFTHEFFGGRRAWRYQVTVLAADPILYGTPWKEAVLTNLSATETGRPYDRFYVHPREDQPNPPGGRNGWVYESDVPANSAVLLTNDGNVPAPVYAVWTGDLSPSTITDNVTSIELGGIAAGVQVAVDTSTLVAEAPGGGNRSSMIAPGSRPMLVPPRSTVLWHLYSTGSGSVTLLWRDAWA